MSAMHRITDVHLQAVLADLADAAKRAKEDECAAYICGAVANLVAGAGTHAGSAQASVMAAAERAGFTVDYYGNGVRVAYR